MPRVGWKSCTTIVCTPSCARLDFPLPHVGIEDVDDLLIGRHFDLQLRDLGAGDLIDEPRSRAEHAFGHDRLLLGLHGGQGRQPGGAFRLGRPIEAHRRRGAHKGHHHGLRLLAVLRLLFFVVLWRNIRLRLSGHC